LNEKVELKKVIFELGLFGLFAGARDERWPSNSAPTLKKV